MLLKLRHCSARPLGRVIPIVADVQTDTICCSLISPPRTKKVRRLCMHITTQPQPAKFSTPTDSTILPGQTRSMATFAQTASIRQYAPHLTTSLPVRLSLQSFPFAQLYSLQLGDHTHPPHSISTSRSLSSRSNARQLDCKHLQTEHKVVKLVLYRIPARTPRRRCVLQANCLAK